MKTRCTVYGVSGLIIYYNKHAWGQSPMIYEALQTSGSLNILSVFSYNQLTFYSFYVLATNQLKTACIKIKIYRVTYQF